MEKDKPTKQADVESHNIEMQYSSVFKDMWNGFAYCKMLLDDLGRPVDFVYLAVNSSFGRLTNLESVVGKKVTEVIPGIEESNPELFELYGRVALTGQSEQFELEIKSLGIWLSISVYSPEKECFYVVFDNITEQQHVKEQFSAKQHELEELNKTLEIRIARAVEELRLQDKMLVLQDRLSVMGEMINNIAHQWRQPLNELGLLIQQLPIFYGSPEFSREFLEKNTTQVMDLVQHMSRTIDSFRNFFRSDKEAVTFDVNRVIAQTVLLIEKNFADQQISIVLQAEGDPLLSGYPNEYSQVLLNILMNARDALVDNNVADARICVHSFAEGTTTTVTVTDNAGGIADEIMNRIFEPYFTTKGPDRGTGIGLFMSKTIIEKNMGGRLTVRNTGSGAELRIEV